LQIPLTTGLVSLTLNNQTIEFPQIDDGGKLWLQQGAVAQEHIEDRLELRVYRRITDGIPLMVTTQIDLQVSGNSARWFLGKQLRRNTFRSLSIALSGAT
jgi:hypothetical protein